MNDRENHCYAQMEVCMQLCSMASPYDVHVCKSEAFNKNSYVGEMGLKSLT